MPVIEPLQWCEIAEDDLIPAKILSLPPPLPPRDGGEGGALVAHSLIRQWASSDAALDGALLRRMQRSVALITALEDGTYPSREELAAWCIGEDVVQLAFPGIISPEANGCAELLPVVRAHRDAVVELITTLRDSRIRNQDTSSLPSRSSRDWERSCILRTIRTRHRSTAVVAFSQYADTVDALFRFLSPDGEVAALSGSGGRVAGGPMTRDGILERFAPRASGRAPPNRSEAISLLLTTDLLSEGVNLQDAGVVVHLDLPWTPARMEQRLGRIARIGSSHERVYAYAFRPPASADAIAGMNRALERKMRDAGVVVDAFPSLMPAWSPAVAGATSTPRLVEESLLLLETWLRIPAGPRRHNASRVPVVKVYAPRRGFLAACHMRGRASLIGCLDDCIADAPELVKECLRYAAGNERSIDAEEVMDALRRIEAHIDVSTALLRVRGSASPSTGVRKRALRRISRLVNSSRPHLRAHITRLAERARNVIQRDFGSYAESELGTLDAGGMSGEEWLKAVIDFGGRHARRPNDSREPDAAESDRILAIIVFGDR